MSLHLNKILNYFRNKKHKYKREIANLCNVIYEFIIRLFPVKNLPEKQEIELTLLTMCGKKHIGFLQQSLLSLYNSWSVLPKLQVVSDGSLNLSELEIAFAWWPAQKSFSLWEASVSFHENQGYPKLAEFACKSNVGKKLAAILDFGQKTRILWCDADVLWFTEPLDILIPIQSHQELPLLKLSEDFHPSYDANLLSCGLEHLYNKPFINTGLVFINGNILNAVNLENLFNLSSKQSNHFTEQTILAEAAYQLKASLWTREEIACFLEDSISFVPNYHGKQWLARHYISPVRHLFYRDALALRLGWGHYLFKIKK
ncbi:hypothetical protein H6G33_01035 [Calothrix sp. FACHB-1219]|uniref:hypothetical protein n=1 Tax=unclassified Calothrix TaxID=2619626 RepID=UPI0016877560|nr:MULTISPECIES: hypothetical protein [unclassified Calothrix]MBD2201186.1 hypothetical protein [Calothrix sp. FACHB-168]MBD2215620.1 hypothetical protein [Calothrix sp. FACHB-1219]